MRVTIDSELLKKVAHNLGDGWRFHDIMSKSDINDYYLYNGASLYIHIRYVYGESLPQWTIQYKHPKHKHLQNFVSIGCSIEKSMSAIISDLNNRLLVHTSKAYEKLAQLTDEHQKNAERAQINDYVIEALKKVMNLRAVYDHRFSDSWRIENAQESEVARMCRYANTGDFQLTINSVNADKIIKIVQILSE